MLQRFLCVLLGYCFGCLLTAEFVSFYKSNKSIRTMGSKNPGMTNALRLYGKKYGVIVLIGDLGKTIIACLLAGYLFSLPPHLAVLYAGLGSILGHNFPFWNGFHGGKGVACTCMTLVLFSPIYGLLACIIGLVACLLTKYLVIGGVLIPTIFLLFTRLLFHNLEISLIALIICLLMVERSWESIKRILHGKEERALWFHK